MKTVVTITGSEVLVGDVIKSAAMNHPRRVVSVTRSSTGRTIEVRTVSPSDPAFYTGWYRIGLTSKVRLVDRPESDGGGR